MSSPRAETAVRPMRPADVDEVLSLAASLKDAPHWARSAYLDALNPASAPRRIALVAAASNGSLVGFAVAGLPGGQGELETFAVAPSSQRRGVGRQLLTAMAQALRLAGARELRLEVRAGNLPALALYRAIGFVETGRRPRYYADPVEDAVLMDLHLV
jgi:[ribosomal protein S18]-alanine N-acetyltransferase